MISSFSRDSEQCRKCNYYKDCDEKRRELCAYIIPDENILSDIGVQYVMPNVVSITDCISMNIDAAIARDKLEKELEKELYKQLYCEFRRE